MRLLLILSALLGAPAAASASPASPASPAPLATDDSACRPDPRLREIDPHRLAALGRRERDRIIAATGTLEGPEQRDRALRLLARLQSAAGEQTEGLTLDVIADPAFNAMALPGGFVMVTAGALDRIDSIAAGDQDKADAMVAAILAHELAHLTLGHTGAFESVLDGAPGSYTEERFFSGDVAERGHKRACETDADRTGGLYLLRAGWRIQDAVDLFLAMDSLSRVDDGSVHDLAQLTYLRSHPRPLERAVDLESYRAELRRHQRRLDDAITLIRHNIELERAAELLDRILEDFPHLPVALHARAAVEHRRWLNAVPVQEQRVRSALAVPGSRYLLGLKGGRADELLEHARNRYQHVLEQEVHAPSLSNLALLDAVAADRAAAERHSREALKLEPLNPDILNNRGVVLYMTDRPDSALALFRRAVQAASGGPHLSGLFNLGRTLLETGSTQEGAGMLRLYMQLDSASAWHRLASDHLPDAGSVGNGGNGEDGSVAPAGPARPPSAAYAGIRIRLPVSFLVRELGPPEEQEGAFWHYPQRGLRLVLTESLVGAVFSTMPQDKGPQGVRPGMSSRELVERWGAPDHRDGRVWVWNTSDEIFWSAKVGPDETVVEIGLVHREQR